MPRNSAKADAKVFEHKRTALMMRFRATLGFLKSSAFDDDEVRLVGLVVQQQG